MSKKLISLMYSYFIKSIFYLVKSLYFFKLNHIFSFILYIILRYILKYRYKIVENNIKIINPNFTTKEILETKKLYYKHLSNLILETIWCYTATESEISPKVSIKNMEVFEAIYNSNKNATILLSHIGNWELLCQWAALNIPKLNIITLYTPIKNKILNDLILKYRTRFGVEMVSTKSTLDLYRKQKIKGVSINLFAIDQNPGDPYNQYWTQFFNQEVPVISGAEKFAISQNQDVYFLFVDKIKTHYELELIKLDFNKDKPYNITDMQMNYLEKNIKNKPYLWLLSHNRFKYKK